VSRRTLVGLATCAGVGLYAAMGFGSINYAAHAGTWGLRAMYALCGLYAGASAVRLASARREARAEGGLATSAFVMTGFLLPLAARPEGALVWEGGPWIAALGAGLALVSCLALGSSFGLAPVARGVVSRGPYAAVRHPMVSAFLLLAAGFLLARFSAWNAAVLGGAAFLVVAGSFCEERVLRSDPDYLDYSRRVSRRFVPGLI
jgi:protein-S-isoprenylcysteine O-methyltransferase Ste14